MRDYYPFTLIDILLYSAVLYHILWRQINIYLLFIKKYVKMAIYSYKDHFVVNLETFGSEKKV